MINYKQYDLLTFEEEKQLFKEYKLGDLRAYNRLIECNLLNVFIISQNFYKRNQTIELDELVCIGNEILIISIRKFDHTKNFRLYTYLKHTLNNNFVDKINEYQIVKLPQNKYKTFHKIRSGKIDGTEREQLNLSRYGNISFVGLDNYLNIPE